MELDLDRERLTRRVLFACLGIEAGLLVFDYMLNLWALTDIGALERLADVTRDDSLAGWFVMTQALLIAMTVWAMFLVERRRAEGSRSAAWLGPALFFSYVALDEGIQLHERIPKTVVELVENAGSSFDFFAGDPWILIYLPAYVVVGAFVLGFLWRRMTGRLSRAVLAGMLGCLALAVVLEISDGLRSTNHWNLASRIAARNSPMVEGRLGFDREYYETVQHVLSSIEETLEMLAGSMLWFVLLRHLASRSDELTIKVGGQV